jgi:adenylate kinase
LHDEFSGYNAMKINENMECEIMQVVLEEARESYAKEILVELQSDSIEQMEENVSRIKAWKDQWMIDNKSD